MLLTDERFVGSWERKAREIILAAEITRRYTKEQVLELYLNEIFYGNFSYGIEAAAETYFNTTAADLTLWQSSFLAGLPQAPAEYDIYNNREATQNRNKTVLLLMYQLSNEKGASKSAKIWNQSAWTRCKRLRLPIFWKPTSLPSGIL